jgi:hypothetical protein
MVHEVTCKLVKLKDIDAFVYISENVCVELFQI